MFLRYNTSYNPAKNVTLLKPTNSEIFTKGVLQLLQKIIGDIKKAEEVVNTYFTSGSGESGSGSGGKRLQAACVYPQYVVIYTFV